MPNETHVVHSGPPRAPVVFLLSAEPGAQDALCALLSGRAFSLVSVAVPDWNADLSPWPAPRAFPKGEDFAGRADAFLQSLLQKALPEAEASLGFSPGVRLLAGYSLSGLFALYALTKTGRFDGVASASGSLWYDGFLDFFERSLPAFRRGPSTCRSASARRTRKTPASRRFFPARSGRIRCSCATAFRPSSS